MKTLNLTFIAALSAMSIFGQTNTLVQTSTSTAITATQDTFCLASTTGIVGRSNNAASTMLYIQDPGAKGEAADVISVNGSCVKVARGTRGTRGNAHISGAMVLYGPPTWFYNVEAQGACVTAQTFVTPYVNILTGNQWLCSTITLSWVPGFVNTTRPGNEQPTAAVASAAGLITISGPLSHVTGTAAITGFNIPIGYNGGSFCILPDGAFTTTTANNIALASTAVASKALCYRYDRNASKPFFPSY